LKIKKRSAMQKNVKSISSSIANGQDYYAAYFLREKLGVSGHLNLLPQTYEKKNLPTDVPKY
jgi:hypothetical protein